MFNPYAGCRLQPGVLDRWFIIMKKPQSICNLVQPLLSREYILEFNKVLHEYIQENQKRTGTGRLNIKPQKELL